MIYVILKVKLGIRYKTNLYTHGNWKTIYDFIQRISTYNISILPEVLKTIYRKNSFMYYNLYRFIIKSI